jgi:hypothetical protein
LRRIISGENSGESWLANNELQHVLKHIALGMHQIYFEENE